MHRRDRNLAQNVLWNSLRLTLADVLVELVQRRRHDLHCDPAISFFEDRPVELHNVTAVVGLHHNVQIHDSLLFLFIDDARAANSLKVRHRQTLRRRPDASTHLYSHNFISFLENHFVDTAERTAAYLAQVQQVIGCEIVNLCATKLQLARLVRPKSLATAIKVEKTRKSTVSDKRQVLAFPDDSPGIQSGQLLLRIGLWWNRFLLHRRQRQTQLQLTSRLDLIQLLIHRVVCLLVRLVIALIHR